MPDSALRITLTAIWAALHTTQYGLAITGLNGISEALTCASVPVRDDLVAPFNVGWLKPCVPMSSAQFGLVVSILTMGGLVGALSSDLVTRRFGRIGTLRISAAIIFFGSAAVGLANTFTAMLVGRALIGYGCGLSTVSVPLYLSEIAPPRYKRSLGIMNQFAIVTGMLIAQSLSFPWAKELVWRLVLVVSMGVAVLQLVGSLFMRETRGDLGIEAAVGGDEETPLIAVAKEKPMSITDLFTSSDPVILRGLLVVIVTQLAQQICGVSPVMYFSTRILKPVFPGNSQLVALLIVLFKIPLTLVPAFLIERLGSRRILLFSSAVVSLASFLLAISLNADLPIPSGLAILTFVAAFSVGLGPVTWVVLSEVMPPHASTAAGAIGIGLNWTMAFIMGAMFLPLQEALSSGDGKGEGNIFFVFAATCTMAFVAIRVSYGLYDKVAK